LGFGATAHLMLTNVMAESPVDSGKSSPNLTRFDIYGVYAYTTQINLRGQIGYSQLAASFSGSGSRSNPARSMNEANTSYLFGIEFQF
jgi:hypothetical protein